MTKHRISILLFLLPVLIIINPLISADQLLDIKLRTALYSTGEIKHTFWKKGSPTLIPDIPHKKTILQELADLKPTMSVEVMTRYETGLGNLHSERGLLSLYNTLRSISTMEGIEYFSASRNRMRTLFRESYVVDSPEGKQQLPDPLVDHMPAYSKIYIYQHDLTFGRNINSVEYFAYDDHLIMKTRNLTPMRYFFIPMVKAGNIINYFIFIPQEKDLLIYGLSSVHSLTFFGLEKRKEASFYNRIKAISSWLLATLPSQVSAGQSVTNQ
ncbi:MAG TPA: hypothetical protein ENI06_01900 [Spirochaetales bacterium]|nr:hypothetical protein [Spirochaetales bacterium]